MRIAFIFPPYNHKIFSENVPVVDEKFGIHPPLNLAYVAAIAEKEGHEVKLIDANALGLSFEETAKILKKFKPDLLGFMLTTYMFRQTLSWISYLKSRFLVPTIVGGINLWYYPKETLGHKDIDFAIIGEAIESFPAFLNALENKESFYGISGLSFKDKDKIIVQPPQELTQNIDLLPYPARHLLPNELYHQFTSQRRNFTIMLTSKGCPHGCVFCVMSRQRYLPRDIKLVVDEMEECYRKFGVREIDFFDAVFTGDPDRTLKLCKAIKDRQLPIVWSCRSRIDTVSEIHLEAMAQAGCTRIYFGIESGSQEILNSINKGIKLDDIRRTIATSKKMGIRPLGFFMVGNPGETLDTIRKSVRFGKELKLDYIQFSRTVAKPFTDLHQKLIKSTGKDYWRDYIVGTEEEKRLPNPWTKMSEKQLEKMTKWAYISFYFRPFFIWKTLIKAEGFDVILRYAITAFLMLFSFFRIDDAKGPKKPAKS